MNRGRWLMLAAAVAAAACEDGDGTGPGEPVATVQVSPAEPELAVGETLTLAATLRDSRGATLTGRDVAWSSGDTAVASVSASGVVTARAEGSAVITATSEGRSGQARVTVAAARAAVASVDIAPPPDTLLEGDTVRLIATPRDASGAALDGRAVQWLSSNDAIAAVTPGGRVTALRPGTATITARVEGKSASVEIRVVADHAFDLIYDGWAGVAGVGPELYRLDIRDPAAEPAFILPEGISATDPTPAPDGSRIAFVAQVDGVRGIHVANRDGSGIVRLTSSEFDEQPAWSPDGGRIAFRRWAWADGEDADIWVVDVDGGEPVNLTADLDDSNEAWPAWSPGPVDGVYRIAYSRAADGVAHLWTMDADGGDRRQVTSGAIWDEQAAWSPDGTTLAFTRSTETVQTELYLADATGGNVRRLAALAFGQFAPAWSPDGELIAFASKHAGGGTYQIYTIRPDGSGLVPRTSGTVDKQNPAWLNRP